MLSLQQLSLIVSIVHLPMAVHCGFFDLTDVDDPLSLLWQNKESAIGIIKNKLCSTSDGATGTCMHQAQCLLQQGTSSRNQDCGVLSTCCISKDDSSTVRTITTRAKVSYFTSGNNPQSSKYIVQVANNNICQMKLDFVSFFLAPSSEISADSTAQPNKQRRICSTDTMTVEPNNFNIPEFCARNDGQHVYVHLNGQKEVTLSVKIGTINNNNNFFDGTRRWNIKVTQLECPGPKQLLTKHKTNSNAYNDFNLLAPAGAIQYFTNPTGFVESFGYPETYISGLNYAIAFKKRPPSSCIDFVGNPLILRRPGIGTSDIDCTDYLTVPGLANEVENTNFVTRICFTVDKEHRFSQITPGPNVIYFVSDDTYDTESPVRPHLFRLQYEIKSSC